MELKFRRAEAEDMRLYFDWANDPVVRAQSYHQGAISWEGHCDWFSKKIEAEDTLMLLFLTEQDEPVGQVRFERVKEEEADPQKAIVGISIALEFRGQGLASRLLQMATAWFQALHPETTVEAWIKTTNPASKKAFTRAGYVVQHVADMLGTESWCLHCLPPEKSQV